jgi:GNAT superfamily N-acetyltransferase
MDVSVRPLRADEGALLDAVFAGLSPHSQYLRFHAPVHHLTGHARRALLDLDGRDHLALVATSEDGEPVGIARLIRDPARAAEAEAAFEVVDAWQGRGVGRLLLTALAEQAVRLGIGRVHALVLTANAAAMALLRSVFPVCLTRPGGETTELIGLVPGVPGGEITMDDVLADLAA